MNIVVQVLNGLLISLFAGVISLLRGRREPALSREDMIEQLVFDNPLGVDIANADRVYERLVDCVKTEDGHRDASARSREIVVAFCSSEGLPGPSAAAIRRTSTVLRGLLSE